MNRRLDTHAVLEAYNEGSTAARADRLLGRRSEYTWNTPRTGVDEYSRVYADGYRDTWKALEASEVSA